jgi:DNA-binding LytR/AlgR family response regulator
MSRFSVSIRDWASDLAIATAIGAFLGLIGPFGSYYNGPAWQRVGFQVVNFWVGVLIFGALVRVLLSLKLRPSVFWLVLAASVAAIDVPFSMGVHRFAALIWPRLARFFPGALEWYLQGLLTSAPVITAFVFVIRHREHRRALAREAGEAPPSREGLLGAAPSQVICLQMEDHYVRVHTAGGSRLVLSTLSQAMAALGASDGLQVHRSWWVARKAVVRAYRDGRRVRLDLINGVSAPVARSAVASVREAGWMSG